MTRQISALGPSVERAPRPIAQNGSSICTGGNFDLKFFEFIDNTATAAGVTGFGEKCPAPLALTTGFLDLKKPLLNIDLAATCTFRTKGRFRARLHTTAFAGTARKRTQNFQNPRTALHRGFEVNFQMVIDVERFG